MSFGLEDTMFVPGPAFGMTLSSDYLKYACPALPTTELTFGIARALPS